MEVKGIIAGKCLVINSVSLLFISDKTGSHGILDLCKHLFIWILRIRNTGKSDSVTTTRTVWSKNFSNKPKIIFENFSVLRFLK